MKVYDHFFLKVIGFVCFSYLSQAAAPPHKSIVGHVVNSAPRLLHIVQNGSNMPASDKVKAAALLRKNMRIEAMIQRAWITSMVVPGWGQVYNKDYWKVPCLYLGFALVGYGIYSEHQAMHHHKRTLLMDGVAGKDKPTTTFTEKRIQECTRTRNLYVIIASAWYLLNILDAYAGGHDKTINFTDDIGTK